LPHGNQLPANRLKALTKAKLKDTLGRVNNSLKRPRYLMLCAGKGRGKDRKTISLPLADG